MKKQLLFISAFGHLLIGTFVYTGLSFQALAKGANNTSKTFDPGVKEKARQWMQHQPVQFIENKGQMADMNGKPVSFVLFKTEAPGMDMYITEKGLTYVFNKSHKEEIKEEEKTEADKEEEQVTGKKKNKKWITWGRIDMDMKGASIKKENIIKEGMSADFSQYFLAHCPEGITDVRSYEKITIKEIYPGIDWVFYNSSEKGFKYDFIVHPGADPEQIELIYSSLIPLKLDKAGNINIQTEIGTLTENAPYSYMKETKQQIATQFQVIDRKHIIPKDSSSEEYYQSTIRFKFENRNMKHGTLVIDPQLFWATFFGSTNFWTGPQSITTDAFGNLFVTGYTTLPTGFPVFNANTFFQGTSGGSADAFIIKFSNTGVLRWATYYGGSGSEGGNSIATDLNGNVFVTGNTSSDSTTFPLQNAGTFFQGTYAGGPSEAFDAFILKFDNAGNRLWATYYGGDNNDYSNSIATDGSGNVFVTGWTRSLNFPVQNAGPGTFFKGTISASDAFILKFDNAGNRLWATYYGGRFTEESYAITTDSGGNIFLTGTTGSDDTLTFLKDAGTFFQGVYAGAFDAFIAKFDNAGNHLWATLYGGNGIDNAYSIATDPSGNVFVTGSTNSPDFPLQDTGTFFQGVYGGGGNLSGGDAFILKFDNAGNRIWATYFGGAGNDYSPLPGRPSFDNLAIDACGSVYMSFETNSVMLTQPPCDGGYVDNIFNGGAGDQFIVRFSNTGVLLWSTYLGGNGNDFRSPLAVDNAGNLFVSGEWTNHPPLPSPAFDRFSYPLTRPAQAYFKVQPHFNGDEGFVVKFNSTQLTITTAVNAGCGCNSSATANPVGDCAPYSYLWSDGQTTQTATGLCTGNYTVTVTGISGCTDTASVTITAVPPQGDASFSYSQSTFCQIGTNPSPTITGSAGGIFTSSTGLVIDATTGEIDVAVSTLGTYSVTYTTNDTCPNSSTFSVTITLTPDATFSYTGPYCQNATPDPFPTFPVGASAGVFSATPAGLVFISTITGQIDLAASAPGTYTVTNSIAASGGCAAASADNTVTVNTPPVITISSSSDVTCNGGNNGSAIATASAGIAPYSYLWNTIPAQTNDTAIGLTAGTYTVQVTDLSGCQANVSVTISQPSSLIAMIANSVNASCFGGTNGSATGAATGGTGLYSYSWNTTPPQTTPTATELTAGTYIFTVTDANNCIDTATVNITAPPPITFFLLGPTNICSGQLTFITTVNVAGGTMPYTYNWNPGALNGNFVNVSPVVTTSYTVTVTDVNNCTTAPDSFTITVNPVPVLVITNPAAVCSPETVDITSASITNGSTGGGTLSYWTDAAATNALASPDAVAVSGTYYIQSTTDAGCSDIEPVTVTIHPLPTPVVTPAAASICSGAGTSLTASGASTYSWSPAAGLSSTNGATVSANPAITTTYTVTATDTNTCVNTTTVTVTVQPLPILSVASDSICEGENTMIDAIASGGTAPYAYLWNPGAMTGASVNVSPSVTTTYTVVVSDANNCFSSPQLATVTVFPNPVANFEMIPPDYAPVSNPLILFTDQSAGADHWLWNFGDILNSLSTLKDPSFTFADEGMYHVTLVVTNNEGCTDSVSHTIIIESDFNIYIPSAFTPDNDGLNDFFAPQGINFNSFEMEIYNRWGEKIYDTEALPNPSRGEGQWDGTISGKDSAPQGVYVYKIWVKDFMGEMHYYVGNVTLVR